MDDYIAKPIREEELAKVISKIMESEKSVMLALTKKRLLTQNKISEKSLPGDTIPEAIYFSMIKNEE